MDLVGPFCIYIFDIKFFDCAVGFNLVIGKKGLMSLPKVM